MKMILNLVFLAFLFVGCSRTQNSVINAVVYEPEYDMVSLSSGSNQEKLEISFRYWNNLKDNRGSSYQYTSKNVSAWGGQKSETVIVVYNDFVLNRFYYEMNGNEITSSWKEEGFDALNTHDNGAPVRRLDELYDDCQEIINTKDDVTLSFDTNGLLATCMYGKRGITIENFFFQ